MSIGTMRSDPETRKANRQAWISILATWKKWRLSLENMSRLKQAGILWDKLNFVIQTFSLAPEEVWRRQVSSWSQNSSTKETSCTLFYKCIQLLELNLNRSILFQPQRSEDRPGQHRILLCGSFDLECDGSRLWHLRIGCLAWNSQRTSGMVHLAWIKFVFVFLLCLLSSRFQWLYT